MIHRPHRLFVFAGHLVLALALAPAGASAQLQPSRDPAAEQAALAEGVARRVLELESGDFLRARTRRLQDGPWQLYTEGAWRNLPGVSRASTERELLARADELADQAGSDPVRRVALADWMARQGLATESLKELDRVLRDDPVQADALRLLASPPRGLDLFARSDDPEVLFGTAVVGAPALRELALARLGEVESEASLEARFVAAFGSSSTRTRATGALGLGRHFPGEHIEDLLVRSVIDASEDVRREAAQALGAAREPAVIVPLVRALASDHGKVRVHAAQALGNAGYPAAVAPLMTALATPQSGSGGGKAPAANIFIGRQMAYIQDFDVEVAAGASVADPTVNVLTEGSVLDARVQGVGTYTIAVESRYLRRALEQLTGADPGKTRKAWLDWWKQNGGDWAPASAPAGDGQTSSSARR